MALRVESEVILKLYNLKPQNFKEKNIMFIIIRSKIFG